MHLPQGYQTFIGSSEGQSDAIGPAEKILLSMARALLREPRIILVDQTGWETLAEDNLKVSSYHRATKKNQVVPEG